MRRTVVWVALLGPVVACGGATSREAESQRDLGPAPVAMQDRGSASPDCGEAERLGEDTCYRWSVRDGVRQVDVFTRTESGWRFVRHREVPTEAPTDAPHGGGQQTGGA